ncbi:zf-HC2 domain-containing protein [Marmoricola sp. RAF53]|uniref:zf-HC2 domain-containing protein n=1 Tax=Marmoricola sp. RAF53 TaxID=3233059 RepID=UPI003F9A503B
MIIKLHGHIGSHASALVDGQLSAADEERAWNHVLGCPGCRRLVEREGWVKRRVAGLNGPVGAEAALTAPAGLIGNLYDVDAWAVVDEIERRSTRRRTSAALVGAGSVGIAVLAMVAISSPPAGRGEVPGRGPVVGPARISQSPARDEPGTGLTADVDDAAFGRTSR